MRPGLSRNRKIWSFAFTDAGKAREQGAEALLYLGTGIVPYSALFNIFFAPLR
jgi:hypothetical protein